MTSIVTIEKILMETPAMAWLKGAKKDRVIDTIKHYEFGLKALEFVTAMRQLPPAQHDLATLADFANTIAQDAPIAIDPRKIAFFSGTAQPRAEAFVNEHFDFNIIHTTLPGALLEILQLFDPVVTLTREQRYAPWNKLSSRLALLAEGNTTAILDTPKPYATFINYEMPIFLLRNTQLLTINDTPKQDFWENLALYELDAQATRDHKSKILSSFTI